jgi:peptidyl-prolyl cis-trans isomerase SurA
MKIFALVFFLAVNIMGQESADKIVAVVDDEIIMKSELDYQVNILAIQTNSNPDDPKLRKRILNDMITQKLLYAQAELDSVVVTDEEVEQQLDLQLNYFISQYGSRERVEQTYGMSIERIKREFRDDTRKQMMGERLKQQKFGNVNVTRREVEEFYENYKDSLGLIPEKFELSHIFINPIASDKVKKEAYNLAKTLLDSIKNGADFAELAKEYSDDPGSASKGGDLGTVKRGVFFPEFEAAAFALAPGELSDVVESPVGFHIIQLLERKGESIHTRHILIKIKADDDADLRAIELLSDLRDSIVSGKNTFAYYAEKYSDDKQTSKFGGDLGTLEVNQLDKPLLDKVYKMKEGEISFPKRIDINRNNYGFHIIYLRKRTPEHIANLDQDFEDIKKLAEYQKREKLFNKWLSKVKEDIYWEIIE